jgi:plastocyanin
MALAMLSAGCDSDDDHQSPAAQGTGTEIEAEDFYFDPANLTVPKGTAQIEVTNTGKQKHTFTSDELKLDVEIKPEATLTVAVSTLSAGKTVAFHCRLHPEQMTGSIRIE